MTLKTEDFQKKILGFGPGVHNGLNQNEMIPAAGTHIPHFFIGTFDFSEALLYHFNIVHFGLVTPLNKTIETSAQQESVHLKSRNTPTLRRAVSDAGR